MTVEDEMKILEEINKEIITKSRLLYSYEIKEILDRFIVKGEWIDYNNTFYKCPDCGYLLEKYCPQCQNKVILPKGGAV